MSSVTAARPRFSPISASIPRPTSAVVPVGNLPSEHVHGAYCCLHTMLSQLGSCHSSHCSVANRSGSISVGGYFFFFSSGVSLSFSHSIGAPQQVHFDDAGLLQHTPGTCLFTHRA